MRYSSAPATEEHKEGEIVPFNPRTGQVERLARLVPIEKWSHSDWGLEIAFQCRCGWLSAAQNGSQQPQFYIVLAHDEWYDQHIPATLTEARRATYRQLAEKVRQLLPPPDSAEEMEAWLKQVDEVSALGQRLVQLGKKISFIQELMEGDS